MKDNNKIFNIGDLVKHASKIKWRDQDALGCVVEVLDHHSIRVEWLNHKPRHNPDHALPKTFYNKSLELVAR